VRGVACDCLCTLTRYGEKKLPQFASLTTQQIQSRVRMLEGNIRALATESSRLEHEKKVHEHRLKENMEKIKLNKQLPFLVSNVVEVRRSCGVCSDCFWP
jgi:ATP-dependent 26S proteasome regulatory subunit